MSNADTGLYKSEMEKNVYKKINEMRKFYRKIEKEKEIRTDIIESAIGNNGIDNILDSYKKALNFKKVIKKQIGEDVVFIYKRS